MSSLLIVCLRLSKRMVWELPVLTVFERRTVDPFMRRTVEITSLRLLSEVVSVTGRSLMSASWFLALRLKRRSVTSEVVSLELTAT